MVNKQMTGLKPKPQKVKIISPFIAAAALIYMINSSFSNELKIVPSIFILLVAIFNSVHFWKMSYNEKYRKEKEAYIAKSEVYVLYNNIMLFVLNRFLFASMVISLLVFLGFLIHFFRTGFSESSWQFVELLFAMLGMVVFLVCFKAYNRKM